jgi:IclR family KDG regulon transcriptional repressor
MPKTKYTMKSLDAAIDVLETFLQSEADSRGITEISRITGLSPNRVFRILSTLAERGYVLQDDRSQDYCLGRGFLLLGEAARDRFNLRRNAKPYLEELAAESGDAADLLVRFGDQVVVIDREYGWHRVQASGPIGEAFPLHISSAGKLFLAELSQTEVARWLSEIALSIHGPRTITSIDELKDELDQIRARGYSTSKEEIEEGLFSTGAAVRDSSGLVVAGILLTWTTERHDEEHMRRNAALVMDAGSRLSHELGYRR